VATRNTARFLSLFDSFGTIETGKVAGFSLLDANPLEKIENTRRIYTVIVNGWFLSIDTLQRMQGVGSAENRKGD
jgi:imidazolonepropionase-like amidohydrolase